ncbi:hypothetical protein GCM10010840_35580 [Deinococcus aerolatus]|uniref:Uncharacterized protein n=1 Tax=Deinococcus aerolatus TaxID=522487 RepID=A0ABQ2GFV4_9DEIO|nr:hypothetical protein GCM10010840_35580 [Deinococcus aerolatus]
MQFQYHTAGNDDTQVGGLREEGSQVGGRTDEVFEAVENKQQTT